jgi:hypothetical protein
MPDDSWFSNFSKAGGWYYLALALSPPDGTEAAEVKMHGAVILPAANVHCKPYDSYSAHRVPHAAHQRRSRH